MYFGTYPSCRFPVLYVEKEQPVTLKSNVGNNFAHSSQGVQ